MLCRFTHTGFCINIIVFKTINTRYVWFEELSDCAPTNLLTLINFCHLEIVSGHVWLFTFVIAFLWLQDHHQHKLSYVAMLCSKSGRWGAVWWQRWEWVRFTLEFSSIYYCPALHIFSSDRTQIGGFQNLNFNPTCGSRPDCVLCMMP